MQNYEGSLETFFVEVPTIWISKGPKQTILFCPLGPQAKFQRGPLDFQGPRAFTSGPPRALTTFNMNTSELIKNHIYIFIFR